jgi:hypothetical protein
MVKNYFHRVRSKPASSGPFLTTFIRNFDNGNSVVKIMKKRMVFALFDLFPMDNSGF